MKKPETGKHLQHDMESEAAKLEHEASEAREKAEKAECAGDFPEMELHRKTVIEKMADAQKLRDIIREK